MKDSILVFGGGELQYSIILKVKELGFNAVVIDPNPLAPAKNIADVFVQVGGDDFDKTLSIANQYKIKGIVTAATDHPILMMSKIASELKLAFPSFESCEMLLNKGKFKAFLKKNNLPHAKGNVFTVDSDFTSIKYNFPLIIKPVKNSGSRGVIKCNHEKDLPIAIDECVTYCKDGRFIIEEYINGDEISVEAIVVNGLVEIIQITDKIVSAPPYNVELGHIQPSKYQYREREIKNILQKIINITAFDNSVIHPEFKIDSEGNIWIIEIGTRLGGDYITSDLTPLSSGIDIELLQIFIAINKPFHFTKVDKCAAISFFNFKKGSVVCETVNENEIMELFTAVKRFCNTLTVGDTVNGITNSLERYGYFIVQCDSIQEIKYLVYTIDQFISAKFFK